MPEYKWPITIKQLIYHTSGIRDYESLQYLSGEHDDQGEHHNEDIMELVARQKVLNFKPGDQYLYCNSGYTLLAIIVERVCGQSIGQFVKDNIFTPLSMNNSFIYEDNRVVVKNRATGYSFLEGQFAVDETLNESTGDGGVFTSVEDFYLWDQNFYDNKIDCPDFLAKMKQIGKLNDGTNAGSNSVSKESGYGYGLSLSTYRGLRTLGHGGAYVGFRARFIQFPDQKFSLILLANFSSIDPTKLCHKIADIFLEKYFTEPPLIESQVGSEKEQRIDHKPRLKGLTDYTGNYYSDELLVTYKLKDINGRLFFAQKKPPTQKPLQLVSEGTFAFEDYILKFTRDSQGKISGFSIDADRSKNIFFKKIL
jgi:CubicO group peptidase (beta-lactamase class C family)